MKEGGKEQKMTSHSHLQLKLESPGTKMNIFVFRVMGTPWTLQAMGA